MAGSNAAAAAAVSSGVAALVLAVIAPGASGRVSIASLGLVGPLLDWALAKGPEAQKSASAMAMDARPIMDSGEIRRVIIESYL